MHIRLVDLAVVQDLLDRLKGAMGKVSAELFKMGTGEGGVEIDTLKEGINFDGSLGGRESAFCTFASSVQTTECTRVRG